jgi:hypothetical protein
MPEVNYRDRAGRFQEGGPGGPGRPPKRKEEYVLTRLWELTTEEDLEAGLRAIIEGFRNGWKFHTRLFMEYMVGRPAQVVEFKHRGDLLEIVARVAAAGGDAESDTEADPVQ